jgi:hypothetical protein
MSDLTMPALFTVLVGDDPERRVATRDWRDDYWVCDAGGSWFPLIDKPRDVQPFIPDGTPVDRIVVKGHGVIERWIATCDRCGTHTGKSCVTPEEAQEVMRAAGWTAYHDGLNACHDCASVIAVFVAARAAEPTPDPLAQHRANALEWLDGQSVPSGIYNAITVALLAATEGGAS